MARGGGGHNVLRSLSRDEDYRDHQVKPGTYRRVLQQAAPFRSLIALFITTIVVFLIVLAIAVKAIWPKILAGLDEREAKIRDEIRSAEEAREQAKGLLSEYEKNLAEARNEANQMIAKARNAVGGAQYYAGDVEGAEQSFALNRDAADPIERYRARNNLGSLAGVSGRPREALAHLEVALTLGRAAGEHAGVVSPLNNLAATAERIGDYRRAVRYFKEGLALARQTGSATNEGQLLVNLSVVYSRLGELGPAWNTALEVEELAEEQGDARLRMQALGLRAEVSLLCGQFAGAGALLEAAAALAATIGDERKQASLKVSRAVVAAHADPAAEASAEAQLAELAEPRWADVTPWLWLELSLLARDPLAALRRVAKVESLKGDNDHLSFLMDLGRLRAGLMPGAEAMHDEAAEAFERLRRHAATAQSTTYVQTPRAVLLCARWRDRGNSIGGGELADATEGVRAVLAEQVAGLPGEVRACVPYLPEYWLSGLDPQSLTMD